MFLLFLAFFDSFCPPSAPFWELRCCPATPATHVVTGSYVPVDGEDTELRASDGDRWSVFEEAVEAEVDQEIEDQVRRLPTLWLADHAGWRVECPGEVGEMYAGALSEGVAEDVGLLFRRLVLTLLIEESSTK